MKTFGLIGYPLSHSFSKKYFTHKFEQEEIFDCTYELFELKKVDDFPSLIRQKTSISGLNVTIPYKESIIPFLDRLADSARQVGAVNVICFEKNGTLTGYNSDYYGFLRSLELSLSKFQLSSSIQALILGTGGASKAVQAVLTSLQIPWKLVSRKPSAGGKILAYNDLNEEIIASHQLIVNTTPLGMYPKITEAPSIPYTYLTSTHFLYDLVYNPEETTFLKEGLQKEAYTKGGLEMLHFQAEKAWNIWNNKNISYI